MTLRESAAWWAELGGLTFPLTRKKPTRPKDDGGQGFKDANLSAEGFTAAEWSRSDGLGLRTGSPSGLTVLDVDSDEGRIWLAGICAVNGYDLEAVPTVLSAKGPHYYFRPPPGVEIPRKIRALPGIDILGDGGYVVAPGSIHPGDPELGLAPGHLYVWVGDPPESLEDIPELPKFLLEAILESISKPKPRAESGDKVDPRFPMGASEGRNNYLASVAGELVSQGLEQWVIESALLTMNEDPAVFSVPMSEARIRGTIFKSVERWIEERAIDTELGTEWDTGAELGEGLEEVDPLPPLSYYLANPELLEPPTPILPSLAYQGLCTVLAGNAKMGKSTLIGQAVAALSQGAKFLDTTLTKGRVLYVAPDESLGMTVARLHEYGADPELVHIYNTDLEELPKIPISVELAVKRHDDVRLIVIDSVIEYIRTTSGSVPSYGDTHDWNNHLREVTAFAHKFNVAVLLLHHANNAGSPAGGDAVKGAVDGLVSISLPKGSKRPTDTTVRVLAGNGRGFDTYLRLTLDPLTTDVDFYMILDGEDSLESDVLNYLKLSGPRTRNQVTKGIERRRQAVYAECNRLIDQGVLAMDTEGLLCLK